MPQQSGYEGTSQMIRSLKTAAIATVLVLATSAGAFAATTAWIDEDTKVKEDPDWDSDTIAWAHEGQKVKILDHEDGFYYVKRKGKDGWVDEDDVTFDHHADVDVDFDFGSGGIEVEFQF
jgi:uncharacterized protein YgiM (DUF1202 family)